MGINISNSLLVGASYEELEDFIQSKVGSGEFDDKWEVLDEYFERASPWYDAGSDECFYGFRVENYKPVTNEWFTDLVKLSKEFEDLTGIKPRLRGGAHVW